MSIGRKKCSKNTTAVLWNTFMISWQVMNRGFTHMSPKVNSSRLYRCFKMSQIQQSCSRLNTSKQMIAWFFGKAGHVAIVPLEQCIHTYKIGHYNPSVRIIDLVSDTTYSLKSTPNDRFFWETFHGNFILLSEFLPEVCWEEIAEEILFVFCFDVWPGARTQAFRLISQHTTY